jgi:hypothetical protein
MPMQTVQLLDALPLQALFVATIAVVLASLESGFRLGLHRRRQAEEMKDAAIGSMVGAMLGLLAFMLAFTFGMASARHDTRRALVLEEANAVQTTYLRAGFLAEPQRSEIRALLREYVDVRVEGARQKRAGETFVRSEEIHGLLWSRAVTAGEKNPGSIMAGLFIQSLNEVIDIHAKRLKAALRSRIPEVIMYVLYFVTVLSMVSMGYLEGLAGKRIPLVTYALVLAFSSVLFLINDLDRPLEGPLNANQQALIDLREKLK